MLRWRVLIVTHFLSGAGVSVHTVVAEFETQEQADVACNRLIAKYGTEPRVTAIKLY